MYADECKKITGKHPCILQASDIDYKIMFALMRRDGTFLEWIEKICANPLQYLKRK
jgi:hypothetical protein